MKEALILRIFGHFPEPEGEAIRCFCGAKFFSSDRWSVHLAEELELMAAEAVADDSPSPILKAIRSGVWSKNRETVAEIVDLALKMQFEMDRKTEQYEITVKDVLAAFVSKGK
jgi:hypothetical protein